MKVKRGKEREKGNGQKKPRKEVREREKEKNHYKELKREWGKMLPLPVLKKFFFFKSFVCIVVCQLHTRSRSLSPYFFNFSKKKKKGKKSKRRSSVSGNVLYKSGRV